MRLVTAILAAGLAMSALPASAATTVQFTNIKGTWFDVVDGSSITITGSGTGTTEIRWGTPVPAGGSKSGYRFEQGGDLSLTVDPVTQTSAVTNIGQFTHFNFPIAEGSSITAVKLKFETDVLVNGDPFGPVTFIYAFNHLETPNGANPCADGGPNNAGVNINGCADRVAVNFKQASGAFVIDNVEYALDVRGFLIGGNPADLFWTTENATNTAFIRGQVVARDLAGVIPEPGIWAMLIAGFGMVGAAARRRRPVHAAA